MMSIPKPVYPPKWARTSRLAEIIKVVPSPDDHFLYVLGLDDAQNGHIWVYATDPTGAPQVPPIQIVDVRNVFDFQIHPDNKLAYASEIQINQQDGTIVARIRLFHVHSRTGLLSKNSKAIVPYSQPNGPCGVGIFSVAWFQLHGFSYDGSKLRDDWFCGGRDSNATLYYARNIDTKSGNLGPEKQILLGSGADWFTKRAAIDYYSSCGCDAENSVYVYPRNGGSKPLFVCDYHMLQACDQALGIAPDPFGEYILLQNSRESFQIAKIKLATREIVLSGNSVPQLGWQFNPDGTLIYTLVPYQWNPYYIPIYVFDRKTGATKEGGTILAPSQMTVDIVPVVRQ